MAMAQSSTSTNFVAIDEEKSSSNIDVKSLIDGDIRVNWALIQISKKIKINYKNIYFLCLCILLFLN